MEDLDLKLPALRPNPNTGGQLLKVPLSRINGDLQIRFEQIAIDLIMQWRRLNVNQHQLSALLFLVQIGAIY